ncbi:riboflavine-aldehyde-forming enzyme [Metarhizium acridum CQMa 102]|uniref:Riboflavine-aldehyde-forming enzyme n=1 Tax=Metarhizium acridum (strain CQMa 102) TaxID=655827 RepID=E9DVX0_METAQ|nr:riboflavine-aldehyde-forming enzyme [Metarhizium acridum CQMa 102]EFY92167.1 riboflavine-aldehyde-forming enzyme [Metarhizium acridum CQMa 102]
MFNSFFTSLHFSFSSLGENRAHLHLIAAAPVENDTTNRLLTRGLKSGKVTYHDPDLGACGEKYGEADLVAALAKELIANEDKCGHRPRAGYRGRTIEVEAVDKCMSCGPNDLDLSPAAFRKVIGDTGIGRLQAQWDWI